ncbi:MAG: 2-isopropylmalate synthase, partial [Brevundimonas sp.]
RHPDVVFSTHCHNDLGLAVANSLAAIEGGARQVESTINGIGERAGNASLEEVVMALRVRAERFGVTTGIDATKLVSTSRLLSEITHSPVVRNKAIVGINAFAHEAGIHQHGMFADARTYEIMRPQDVGFEGSFFVLGKHSGRHAVAKRAEVLGHPLIGTHLTAAFAAFKARADEIGEINDAELTAICVATQPREREHAAA